MSISQLELKYNILFNNSNDAIIISRPDGKLVDINPVGLKLLGYSSKQEILKIAGINTLYFNPRDRKTVEKLFKENNRISGCRVALKKKNGAKIIALLSGAAIRNSNGNIIQFQEIIRDITECIENEKLLKQTQARLIHHEKLASIGQLAAGIAHELNNPLGFINNNFTALKKYVTIIEEYLNLLTNLTTKIKKQKITTLFKDLAQIEKFQRQKKLDFILQDMKDLFHESEAGFERIISIVQSLRSFSRVDSNNSIEHYNINNAIEDTLIVASDEIKQGATVEKVFTDVPLIECRGDEINQVILNIIVNAAQAIVSQNRPQAGKIIIKTYHQEEYVYCEISDNGPGIPHNIINKIFDPFFSTKEVGKGVGLGLNISHDIIVNKHKGELSVKSELGKGTTFTIKLPIKYNTTKPKVIKDDSYSVLIQD